MPGIDGVETLSLIRSIGCHGWQKQETTHDAPTDRRFPDARR